MPVLVLTLAVVHLPVVRLPVVMMAMVKVVIQWTAALAVFVSMGRCPPHSG